MPEQENDNQSYQEIVGLVPAGGQATRIAPLPCSKELYPVGFREVQGEVRPKVACHYLLEKMRLAGAGKAFIILREGKWDIPAYLGDGSMVDLPLGYLMMNLPYGAPYTLDQAYPFVNDALIVFGFPDILFQPEDAFVELIARQKATKADLVLGLFPANKPQKMDMVQLDAGGSVRNIVIKPDQTNLKYTWIIAVWTPVFTHFMHEYVASQMGIIQDKIAIEPRDREVYVGNVIQAAIDVGMSVETVLFPEGSYLDIGTPEDLIKAVHNGSRLKQS